MTTYVLVHGAWHGGWCWERVARRLMDAGHRVFAPSLTGCGDRAHLLDERVNLTTHVDDIAQLIEAERLSNVVLVGHSYGAVVVTLVADRMPERLGALVFVDGQVGADGISVAERVPRPLAPGLTTPPPPSAAFMVNAGDRAWVDGRLTPLPNATFLERPRIAGRFHNVRRKMFVRASAYDSAGIRAEYARLSALPDWTMREIACGHDIMVDDPAALASVLLELV